MRSEIFRSAAVERLSTPDRLDQPISITTPLGWLALTALIGLVIVGCVLSVVVAVPIKVSGQGIIISAAGILDVPFKSSGRLAAVAVRSGDHVSAAEVVARLDQPELRLALDQASADLRDLVDQRARIATFQSTSGKAHAAADLERRRDLEQSMTLIRQRLGFLHERSKILNELLSRQVIIKEKVVDNDVEISKAEEAIADGRHKIAQLDLDASSAGIQGQRELLDIDLKIAEAERRVDKLSAQLKDAVEVVSPYAGTVVEFKHDPGEIVQQGTALFSVLPDRAAITGVPGEVGPLVVVLFVSGQEGKKVAPGMTVEIMPSTVQREEYGFMFGRVTSVAAIPSTEEGMMRTLRNRQLVTAMASGGAPFEVEVALDPDKTTPSGYRWSSSRGPSTTIGPGTLATGQVWVRELRLAEIAVLALRKFLHGGHD